MRVPALRCQRHMTLMPPFFDVRLLIPPPTGVFAIDFRHADAVAAISHAASGRPLRQPRATVALQAIASRRVRRGDILWLRFPPCPARQASLSRVEAP